MGPAPTAPDEAVIRDQLARILRSADFARSERLSKFLQFIVEERLQGRSERLKAYTIALAVFDRPSSFDPQSDPLVRIEATRLRRTLERYYLTDGRDDPLLVSVPKGAYIPHIEVNSQQGDAETETTFEDEDVHEAAPVAPRVQPRRFSWMAAGPLLAGLALVAGLAVARHGDISWTAGGGQGSTPAATASALAILPFRSAGADEQGRLVADGLDEALIDQLARLGDLRVLGREATKLVHASRPSDDDGGRRGVRYFVEGSLTTQQSNALVRVRLLDGEQREVIWSTQVSVVLPNDVAAAQADVATVVARILAQPYGAVYRMDAARSGAGAKDNASATACIANYYRYRASLSAEGHRTTRACLEETVRRTPHYATAWALLSLVHLDDIRFSFNREQPFPVIVKRANDAAERALGLEPENIRALQAAMLARFFAGDIEGGRAAGDSALAINPDDTEVLSEYGTRLAQAGEWSRGARMLQAALARNPPNAHVLHGHAAFATLMDGRIEEAAAHLSRVQVDPHPSVLFVRMLVHAENGDLNAARQAFARLRQLGSAFVTDPERELQVRNIRGADLERIRSILHRVRTMTVAANAD